MQDLLTTADDEARPQNQVIGQAGLLIVNADDWGGWKSATDAALACFEAGRITSVTAMVFMADSGRAAELARGSHPGVGLHLNFNQEFTSSDCPRDVMAAHSKVRRFLRRSRYAQLVYNPWLRREFERVFKAQLEEFHRLYERAPSHFDGHQHMHLCANMLAGDLIPAGEFVRRNFFFRNGEKNRFNRWYRSAIDRKLRRRHRLADSFYSLEQCLAKGRVNEIVELAKQERIELMTHPEMPEEYEFLMSDAWKAMMQTVETCSYTQFRQKTH